MTECDDNLKPPDDVHLQPTIAEENNLYGADRINRYDK